MRTTLSLVLVVLAGCASGKTNQGDDDGDDAPPIDASPNPIDAPSQHVDGSGPDAMPITPVDANVPDANPAVPDAQPPPPDAQPCTPITQQRLTNGNWDSTPLGTGWVQLPSDPTYPPVVTAAEMPTALQPQSPSNAVWLGGLLSSTDALYQQLTVPADATSMQITGFKWFATEETGGPFDFMRVQIRSTADSVLETVVQWSNVDSNTAWTSFTLNPTGNYAGQTIRLYLQSQTDSIDNTNFFLDTFSLTVVACP